MKKKEKRKCVCVCKGMASYMQCVERRKKKPCVWMKNEKCVLRGWMAGWLDAMRWMISGS